MKYVRIFLLFLVSLDCCNIIIFRLKPLEAIARGFLLLVCGEARRSSLLTPLKRLRVSFSLLCVKKTFFILVVCGVWLSASCVWRSKAFYLFLIGFHRF